MYKNQGFKVNTQPISVRLRRDILEWMEMEGINKNFWINEILTEQMKLFQRGDRPFLDRWRRKNQ